MKDVYFNIDLIWFNPQVLGDVIHFEINEKLSLKLCTETDFRAPQWENLWTVRYGLSCSTQAVYQNILSDSDCLAVIIIGGIKKMKYTRYLH